MISFPRLSVGANLFNINYLLIIDSPQKGNRVSRFVLKIRRLRFAMIMAFNIDRHRGWRIRQASLLCALTSV